MKLPTMVNLRKVVDILKIRFGEELRCIETGTIRSYTEKHESTRHISEALGLRGSLISIDVNSESIKVSKDICKNCCDNIVWVHSNSLEYLKEQDNTFHFVFLDSVNDKNYIFEEFKLVVPRLVPGGILIVDDAGVLLDGSVDSSKVPEKGHRIAEFLSSLECADFVVESPHGTQLWVDTMNLELNNLIENLK